MSWERFWERVGDRYSSLPTIDVLVFEIVVIVAALVTYRYLNARVMRLGRHFALIAIGVFLLEFFTGPMWENRGLGFWAYVYSDVSWILTIAWTTLILWTVYGVDVVAQVRRPALRFLLYLLVMTPLTLLFDSVVKAIGVRVYAPETLAAAGPDRIPLLDVPAAGLYYIPVFMGLVLSFYKHWLPVVEPAAPVGTRLPLLNRLVLTTAAVFLFEIVVEPMAENRNFPAWSYVFHDITILMTGLWVVIVTVGTLVVDRVLGRVDFRLRFAAYLVLVTVITVPIEGWFIQNGYRVYGPSATADFIGIRTLVGDLPIEVVAAIPLYLSLVISFVRYWDGSVDRSLGLRARPPELKSVTAPDVAGPLTGHA